MNVIIDEENYVTEDDAKDVDYISLLFQVAGECITNGNYDDLTECVNMMNMDGFDAKIINETMCSLILLAYKLNKKDAVDHIFSAFDDKNPVVLLRPSSTTFFTITDPDITPEVYRFVADATDEGYGFHAYNLVNYGNEPGTLYAYSKLEIAYGIQDVMFYDELYDYILQNETLTSQFNKTAANFCIDKLKELNEFEPAPGWLILQENPLSDVDLKARADAINLPEETDYSRREAVGMILGDMTTELKFHLSDYEKAKEMVEKDIESMDESLFAASVKGYRKIIQNMYLQLNDELFRIYGPSYFVIGRSILDTNSDDPCEKYGGCRMHLCKGHTPRVDYDDDEEALGEIDWFTGVCCMCTKKIRARHRAVRMPLPYGGWDTDCYCSWECVKDDIIEPESVQYLLVDYFKDKMIKYGIYDRYYVKTGEEEQSISVPVGYFDTLAKLTYL